MKARNRMVPFVTFGTEIFRRLGSIFDGRNFLCRTWQRPVTNVPFFSA